MSANIKFLSDFIFLIFKELMIGLIFIDSQTGSDKFWYFLRFQIIMLETLKKMKSDKKQVFADIVYFDLIYHSEKKRENSNRGQKMSAKVCQRFLYSLPTLAPIIRHCSVISVSLSVFDSPNQCYPGNPSTHLDCSCIWIRITNLCLWVSQLYEKYTIRFKKL